VVVILAGKQKLLPAKSFILNIISTASFMAARIIIVIGLLYMSNSEWPRRRCFTLGRSG
jgi:hypothetical protein